MFQKNIRIGDLLVESGLLLPGQLQDALDVQKSSGGKRLGQILIEQGIITEEQLFSVLQKRLDVPLLDLKSIDIPREVIGTVPEKIAREHHLIPISLTDSNLIVATNDPLNYTVFNAISLAAGRNVSPVLAGSTDIDLAIERYYAQRRVDAVVEDVSKEYTGFENLMSEEFTEVYQRVDSAPLVRLVSTMITQAFKRRASDVHIEPENGKIRVRYRIDGELVEVMSLNPALHGPIVTRVKIMGGMDIAEKRLPLDGRFETEIDDNRLSVRVSTIPTVYGEKVVLRLLSDSKSAILKVSELGMLPYNIEKFRRMVQSPSGIILVSGPTGSGKTTTLYSVLAQLSTPKVNIVTVEDPVEKMLAGTNQTQINVKAGLTFASGLRSLLRQDPDIIMIGEIRDKETAEIAARAAITGHLVVSSIHTNDAASAFMRLVDMGIEPYIVASSVVGVVAQRLIRLICPYCREEYAPTPEERMILGEKTPEKLAHGVGCIRCNHTGYIGRTAVHEIILLNSVIRKMILDRCSSQEIKEYAVKNGLQTLWDNMALLVAEGKTTVAELLKHTYVVE